MAVLGSVAMNYAMGYLGGEMIFYLGVKVVRGDFRYWVPVPGTAGFAISLLVRVMVKLVVDFTCCMQLRHPKEVSGLYFTMNIFSPLIGLTLLMYIEDGQLSTAISDLCKSILPFLGTALVVLVGTFVLLIEGEYRKTFLSIVTGGQATRRTFLEGDDVMKADLFWNNEVHWSPIRDKVEAWVKEGWATWEEEKPEWFTDQWKSIVPEEMKPTKEKRGADGGDKTAAEVEGSDEALIVGGGEQNGRRRSIVEIISGQKAVSSKVMPAGGIRKEIDEEEFLREIKRRGSINM